MINIRRTEYIKSIEKTCLPLYNRSKCLFITITNSPKLQLELQKFLHDHGFTWVNGNETPMEWWYTDTHIGLSIRIVDKKIANGRMSGSIPITQEKLIRKRFHPDQFKPSSVTKPN